MSPLELVGDSDRIVKELRASRPVASAALARARCRAGAGARAALVVPLALAPPRARPRGCGAARVARRRRSRLEAPGTKQLQGVRPIRRPRSRPAPERRQPSALERSLETTADLGRCDRCLAPSPARLQRYQATLRLRVKDVDALSSATRRAMTLARSLGGYVGEVQYSTHAGKRGGARVVLRVPVGSVQAALTTLTGLGTILQQQTGILDVTRRADRESRQIAKLEKQLQDREPAGGAGDPRAPAHAAGQAPEAPPQRQPRADRADPDDTREAGGRNAEPPPPHARRRRRRAPARAAVPALRAGRRGPAAPHRRRRPRHGACGAEALGPTTSRTRLVNDFEARLRDHDAGRVRP